MDLPINDLTYHSRKRTDDQMHCSFTPMHNTNLPMKYKLHQGFKQQPHVSSFAPKQSSTNYTHFYQSSFQHNNVSPITYLQGSEEKTNHKDHKENQTQNQRQKIRTLSQHLKSALMANNQVQQRYNMLKVKMQERQVKFMNQTSMIKAQMILMQKQLNEKHEQTRKKDNQINELGTLLQNIQKSQQSMRQKYQLQLRNNQSLRSQMVDQRMYQSQISELKQQLTRKDNQIMALSQKIDAQKRQILQYETMLQKQEQLLMNTEKQLKKINKSYDSLMKQNYELKQSIQIQKNRIQELNKHIGQICQNSDHLFQEIKQNKMQKQVLNEQMDKKQLQNIALTKNLEEMIQTCKAYQIKCEQLKMGQEIFDQKTRQIFQKNSKLQQENLQITRINTDLMREIQLLDQQVRQLKQVCIRQECRQAELLTIIKDSQDQICKLKKQLKEQTVSKLRKEVQRQLKPTRDIDRRIKTENQPYIPNHQRLDDKYKQRRSVMRENPYQNKAKFNYLSDHQPQNQLTHVPKQLHPYSHYLSFEPSKPYGSINNVLSDPKTIGYTFGDYPQRKVSRQHNQTKDYYIPNYRSASQNDRKSKSFYVQTKNSLLAQPNDAYKSTFNPREKPYQSIKAMRNSLDLRQKSLDMHNMLKASRKQVLDNPKYKKHERLYTQGATNPQQSYDSKDMFLSKLGKLKLWPKQSTSQQVTQRQALKQLPSGHDYYKPQLPIQTVIKQKSTIIQQRKNMIGFNLNNHMIQKNILKLQKTSQGQKLKENYMDGLSGIRERRDQGYGGITEAVNNACKKVLYNN